MRPGGEDSRAKNAAKQASIQAYFAKKPVSVTAPLQHDVLLEDGLRPNIGLFTTINSNTATSHVCTVLSGSDRSADSSDQQSASCVPHGAVKASSAGCNKIFGGPAQGWSDEILPPSPEILGKFLSGTRKIKHKQSFHNVDRLDSPRNRTRDRMCSGVRRFENIDVDTYTTPLSLKSREHAQLQVKPFSPGSSIKRAAMSGCMKERSTQTHQAKQRKVAEEESFFQNDDGLDDDAIINLYQTNDDNLYASDSSAKQVTGLEQRKIVGRPTAARFQLLNSHQQDWQSAYADSNQSEGSLMRHDRHKADVASSLDELSDADILAEPVICNPIHGVSLRSSVTVSNNEKTEARSSNLVDLNDSLIDSFEENQNSTGPFDLEGASGLNDPLLDVEFEKSDRKVDRVVVVMIVTDVQVNAYAGMNGRLRQEKKVSLAPLNPNQSGSRICLLRDDWYLMTINPGDLAYLSDPCSPCCTLDNASDDFITLFPNTLISGTTIATGITCERKAVLNERFSSDWGSKAMLVGTILHSLFDRAVAKKEFSQDALLAGVKQLLQNMEFLDAMYALNIDEQDILQELPEYYGSLDRFYRTFMNDPLGLQIELKRGRPSVHAGSTFLKLDEVLDIEENIWSPHLGLKGKVDVSVMVNVHRRDARGLPASSSSENLRMPLELKTGRMPNKLGSIEHRAQVAVYSLLMAERHKAIVDSGLLYYMKCNHLESIPVPQQEKRAIIIKRNEIARQLTLESRRNLMSMPDLLKSPRQCGNCTQNQNCMLFHKAVENGVATTSGLASVFDDLTGHLSVAELKFFAKWYELSLLESSFVETRLSSASSAAENSEVDSSRYKRTYIWSEDSETKEREGRCLANMRLLEETELADGLFECTFRRSSSSHVPSLKHFPITVGERVIISDENDRTYNVTTGYVVDIGDFTMRVSTRHSVRNSKGVLFAIDTDRTMRSDRVPLATLGKLFTASTGADVKLRRLIVDLVEPQFTQADWDEHILPMTPPASCESFDDLFESQSHDLQKIYSVLNCVQIEAVRKCIAAKDYVMILGMPGAGKTTTTACLVMSLLARGKSVLLTSYTHSAVDTILLRLLELGCAGFLRLGDGRKVSAKLQPFTIGNRTKEIKCVRELQQFYDAQMVVATTCLGIEHAIFTRKRFDYCIVDEASQITQPVCIGPLRYATSFVLVGDHNQLPPLVQSQEARKKGMDESLFKVLSERHPQAVVTLDRQYRMNKDIMFLTNHLVYGSKMKSGSQDVSEAILTLPFFQRLQASNLPERAFLLRVVDPAQPVVFVDTDAVPLIETIDSGNVMNPGEARLVDQLVDVLLEAGLPGDEIGVISPYRRQLKEIREAMRSGTVKEEAEKVYVDTVDKFQGKDRSCIIVSFVRSNEVGKIGELLQDWRRVNVSITRAKHKLILIGSPKTLVGSKIMADLIKIVMAHNWLVKL